MVLLAQTVLTQLLTFTLRPTAAHRALELTVRTAWLGVLGACFGQAIGPGLIVAAGGASAIPNTTAIFLAAAGIGGLLVGCTLAAADAVPGP